MKIKSQRDFVSGLMFLVAGIAFAWGATEYSFGSSARPGPGYFPFGLGIILAVIGALVTFKSLTIESPGGGKIGAIAWRPLLVIVGAVLAFGFLLPRLGLVLTIPALIAIANLAADKYNWKEVVLLSVVLTIGCWLVFIKGLSLVLPLWPTFLAG